MNDYFSSNEEKNIKNNTTALTIIGIFIFLAGFLVGNYLNFNAISSIQGYLFKSLKITSSATDANATDANATDANATDANATDANATDANATDANATDANATDANATDANATDANATDANATDANATDANATDGNANNSPLNISLKLSTTDITKELYINFNVTGNNFDYILYPSNLKVWNNTGRYIVTKNGTYIFKAYNDYGQEYRAQITVANIDRTAPKGTCTISNKIVKIDATDANGIKEYRYTINLDKNNVIVSTNSEYKSYTNIKDAVVEVFDVAGNKSILMCNRNGQAEEQTPNYKYSSAQITAQTLEEINDAPVGTTINIDADENPIVPSELFDAIKNKDKNLVITINKNQIAFNGNDIESANMIDATITSSSIANDNELSSKIKSGYVVSLPSNTKLPGKAVLKLNATDEIRNTFINDEIYVYLYDAQTTQFKLIQSNVKLSDNLYYEFEVDNASKYVLVDDKIENLSISENETTDETVSFIKSNQFYILLIVGAVLLILFVVVVITYIKNRRKNPQNINF